eukprot:TRINITY_DN11818_c0_g1_i1.p1 TRINITY_DN11818_c0_g1~~TRINITY_DN11818_c0_g1_i1.p1  ORF type:complete len:680 (+),score=175.42 TRINITY_DN11818_c0_g1_i1:70-2109(+)
MQRYPGKKSKPQLRSISMKKTAASAKPAAAAPAASKQPPKQLPPLPSLGMKEGCVGAKCYVREEEALIRYRGPVYFAEGEWFGVQFQRPKGWEGACDGKKEGTRYFTTEARCGFFVREEDISHRPPEPVANPVSLLAISRARRSTDTEPDEGLCSWHDTPSPLKSQKRQYPHNPPPQSPVAAPDSLDSPASPYSEPEVPAGQPSPLQPPTPPEVSVIDHRSVIRESMQHITRMFKKVKDAAALMECENTELIASKERELKEVLPDDGISLDPFEGVTEEFCNVICNLPEAGRKVLQMVGEHPAAGCSAAEHDEALRRLQFEADDIMNRKEEAILKGDVGTIEALFERCLACHEAITVELRARVESLTKSEQEGLEVLEASVKDGITAVKGNVESYQKGLAETKQAANEYFKRTFAILNEKEETGHTRRRAAMEKVHKATAEMQQNATSQQEKWEDVHKLVNEIKELIAMREKHIENKLCGLDAVMVIDKSLYEVRKKTLERESHREYISKKAEEVDVMLKQNVEHCMQVLKEAESLLRDKKSEHFNATLLMHSEHYEGFKGVFMLLGEYQHKKLMHKEALGERLAEEENLVQYYGESLNPSAKDHAQQRDALQVTIDALTLQIDEMEEKLCTQEKLFVSTSERPLIEAGRDLPHPRIELEKLKCQSRAKLIAYKNLEEN